MRRSFATWLCAATLVASCGADRPSEPPRSAAPVSSTTPQPAPTDATGCADVIAVELARGSNGYTVRATVASADTGWEKYADLWTISTTDGVVLGERVLAHPHVDEQPFTRSLDGVVIPAGTAEVVIAARDSVLGFCGATITASVEDQ
jgi:hypothetical protein